MDTIEKRTKKKLKNIFLSNHTVGCCLSVVIL